MTRNPNLLIFGQGNSKLSKEIFHISTPAGWSCPGTLKCLSRVMPNGKLQDGPETEVRCFAASLELLSPALKKNNWHNFNLLKAALSKGLHETVKLIEESIPLPARIIRLNIGGDFFSSKYFQAWCLVAQNNPHILFYAYTKSINYWVENKGLVPDNFKLTASYGGKYDHLIKENEITRTVEIVDTEGEAKEKGLEVDHDDFNAYALNRPFALVLHGQQPSGVKAKIWNKNKGKTGYGRKSKFYDRGVAFRKNHYKGKPALTIE